MIDKTEGTLLPPPPALRRWPRIVMLGAIFFCGTVAGTAIGALWMRDRMIAILRHPEQLPNRILPRIRATLSLSDDQARRVNVLVRKRHAVMESLRAESYPRQLEEFKAMQSEIAELLSPQQRLAWAKLCETVENCYLPVRPAGPPAAELIFDQFDANHDEGLEEDEVGAGMWRRLKMADHNSDGKVTREEYLKAQPNVISN